MPDHAHGAGERQNRDALQDLSQTNLIFGDMAPLDDLARIVTGSARLWQAVAITIPEEARTWVNDGADPLVG